MQISFPQKNHFGVLTADEVRTPIINAPLGTMQIQASGADYMTLVASRVRFNMDMRLQATKLLRDFGDAILLDPDDAGNIVALASITGAILAPDGKLVFTVVPSVASVGEGSIYTPVGWLSDANHTLKFVLNACFPSTLIGSQWYLHKVKVFYETTHNDTYIGVTQINSFLQTDMSSDTRVNDPTDRGNGSSGDANYELTTTSTDRPTLNDPVILQIGTQVTSGVVRIKAIECNYTLTP